MSNNWNMMVGAIAVTWLVATAYATQPLWHSTPASPGGQGRNAAEQLYLTGAGCGQRAACAMTSEKRTCSGCGWKKTGFAPRNTGDRIEKTEAYLQRLYAEKFNDPRVMVRVKDFGCHMEADILKNGKMVKRVAIEGRSITEIS